MGNRVYIHTVANPPSQGPDAEVLSEVAEYANGLPALWRVMLSVGVTADVVAEPSPYLFVPGLPTLYGERAPAENRLREVLELLAEQADLKNDPAFIQRKRVLLEVFLPSLPGAWFAFSLDELSWMEESSDPATVLADWTEDFDEMWRECEVALRARDADALTTELVYGPARVWSSVLGMENWSDVYFRFSRPGESWTDFAARDRSTWHEPVSPVAVTREDIHGDDDESSMPSASSKFAARLAKSLMIIAFILFGGLVHVLLRWAFGDSSWWRWPLWGIVVLFIWIVVGLDGKRQAEDDGEPSKQ